MAVLTGTRRLRPADTRWCAAPTSPSSQSNLATAVRRSACLDSGRIMSGVIGSIRCWRHSDMGCPGSRLGGDCGAAASGVAAITEGKSLCGHCLGCRSRRRGRVSLRLRLTPMTVPQGALVALTSLLYSPSLKGFSEEGASGNSPCWWSVRRGNLTGVEAPSRTYEGGPGGAEDGRIDGVQKSSRGPLSILSALWRTARVESEWDSSGVTEPSPMIFLSPPITPALHLRRRRRPAPLHPADFSRFLWPQNPKMVPQTGEINELVIRCARVREIFSRGWDSVNNLASLISSGTYGRGCSGRGRHSQMQSDAVRRS